MRETIFLILAFIAKNCLSYDLKKNSVIAVFPCMSEKIYVKLIKAVTCWEMTTKVKLSLSTIVITACTDNFKRCLSQQNKIITY